MTLLGAPLSTLGPAVGLAGGVMVALYLLKLRRRRVPVPFSLLWQQVLGESRSSALFRRLRRLLSLLLQLLLLTLLGTALANPRLGASPDARTVAFLIDTSASMATLDGGNESNHRSRLQRAKDEAKALVGELGPADSAMIVALDARPRAMGGLSTDEQELRRQLDALSQGATEDDPERAVALVRDVLFGHPNPTLIWIGDGAYDPAAISRLARGELDIRFVPVGHDQENVGLTAFSVRRYEANRSAYEVLVEVENFGTQSFSGKLELRQEGEVIEILPLSLAAGQHLLRLYPQLTGTGAHLMARLLTRDDQPPDHFPLDDVAYAVLPERRKERVLLVSKNDLFIEGALLLDQNIEVEKIAPAAYTPALTQRFDAVVFDGTTPEAPPETPALYVDPKGAGSPFEARGQMATPLITSTATHHPLLRFVSLTDVNIARATRFALLAGDVAVASTLDGPLIAAGERRGHKVAALGFPLEKSDLPLRVAFPLLMSNALEWFFGRSAGLVDSYPTGRRLHLAVETPPAQVKIRTPDGKELLAPVHDGHAFFEASAVGFHQLELDGGPPRLFAANLASPRESRIAPATELTIEGRRSPAPPPPHRLGRLGLRRLVWPLACLLCFVLSLAEWWTYHRRVTV